MAASPSRDVRGTGTGTGGTREPQAAPLPPFISLPSAASYSSSSGTISKPESSSGLSMGSGKSTSTGTSTDTAQAAQAQVQARSHPRRVLIFLIPGNPGLVGYYGPFLSHLRRLLDETEARHGPDKVVFEVCGTSLAGFGDHHHSHPEGGRSMVRRQGEPFSMPGNPPNSLEDQIRFVRARVAAVVEERREAGLAVDDVVLMGHSVGSYITCEIFHREEEGEAKKRMRSRSRGTQGAVEEAVEEVEEEGTTPLPLRAGVLLFPTLSHIAQSQSGKRMALLQRVTLLDRYAHVAAALFLALWPAWLLRMVVRAVVGGKSPHGVDTTARWLGSRDGVWQAIHMGKDEMVTIGEDRWGEEFWDGGGGGGGKKLVVQQRQQQQGDNGQAVAVGYNEGETSPTPEKKEGEPGGPSSDQAQGRDHEEPSNPKFFLLYGKEDHWVPKLVRDEFITARARTKRREEVAPENTNNKEDEGEEVQVLEPETTGGGAAPQTQGLGEGRTRIVVDESGTLPHAFCIHHSEAVAEKVKVWIDEVVDHLL